MSHDELLLHQQCLLLRSAQLRWSLADQAQVFEQPLAVADRAHSGLQWLYRNPQWPLAGLLVLLVLRPRRAMLWGGRLWWAWNTFQLAQNWVTRLPLQGRLP